MNSKLIKKIMTPNVHSSITYTCQIWKKPGRVLPTDDSEMCKEDRRLLSQRVMWTTIVATWMDLSGTELRDKSGREGQILVVILLIYTENPIH